MDSDKGDVSEVEAEEDWFASPQDVQPGAAGVSKASQAMNDEVCGLRSLRSFY